MVRALIQQATREKVPLYKTLVITTALFTLLAACLFIISPFIPALLLAAIFTVSTWPAFSHLNLRLHNKTTLAAALMTALLALFFFLPLLILGTSLSDQFITLIKAVLETLENESGRPPAWLRSFPFLGDYTEEIWELYMAQDKTATTTPAALPIPELLLGAGRKIGRGLIDLLLGILISFFFFRHGIAAAQRLATLLDKFLGPRGRHLLDISKKTVIGVVYGMLGTALAQGMLAGVGFYLAQVPGAMMLGLLTVALSFIPAGPPFVWIPATIWLFSQNMIANGLFMAIWGVGVVSMIDNVIRPWFISRGSNMPLLIILIGLFGGVIAFGFIGFFIGPVILAVAYSLIMEWSFLPPRRAFNLAAFENSPEKVAVIKTRFQPRA